MRQLALGCALCALSLAASASAGERHWYLGIEGGLELNTDYDDTAPAVLGTLGAKLGEHFGLEGEIGYRSASEDVFDVDQISGMLNGIYDVPVSDDLVLSVGAGIGLNHTSIELTDPALLFLIPAEVSDTQIAAQVKLGLSYEIGEGTDLIANYRAMRVFENDFGGFDNRTLTVGLRFAL